MFKKLFLSGVFLLWIALPIGVNAACFTQELELGDISPEVSRVQEFLKVELGLIFDTTNFYGPLTRQAVYSFQNKYTEDILTPLGLTVPTGVWGASTLQKANSLCQEIPSQDETPVQSVPVTTSSFIGVGVTYGDTNDQVRTLQEFLNNELGTLLPLTGFFGPMTRDAVMKFQEKYRTEILDSQGIVNATGIVGSGTLTKIADIISKGGSNINQSGVQISEPQRRQVILRKNGPRNNNNNEEEEVVVAAPVNLTVPEVSGDTAEGDTLETTDGTWSGDSLTYTYQWLRDGTDISNATSSTYVLTYADPGTDITVEVTATNAGGSVTAESDSVSVPLASIQSIAFFGDSITSQTVRGTGTNGVGAYFLDGIGYSTWAKAFNGSKWDFEPNGSTLTFATGGKRTDELITLHLENLLATDADVLVELSGTNDVDQSYSTTTIVANRSSIWTQARDVGIRPIAMAIPPFGLAQPGNSSGEKSAMVVLANAALEAKAAELGVPWVDYDGLLETSPDNGVADTTKFTDALHPNGLGANIIGRKLAQAIEDEFILPLDNWTNTNYLTQNTSLAGSSGQPTSWSVPSVPAGATLNSKTLESSSDGNWWILDVTAGTSTGSFALNNFASNIGGAPAGKVVESLVEVQVDSGSFKTVRLDTNMFGGSGANGFLTNYSFSTDALVPDDGLVVLRTTQTTSGTGSTLTSPTVYFSGTGVIRFRRIMTRQAN